MPDREADLHVRFLYTSLILGVGGGFALAILLPTQAALGQMDLTWLALVQVHGHLQVIGFAGLFVVGVASKLAPRFGGGHLAFPALVRVAFWCLLAGVLLRSAQPLAEAPAFGAMMVAGAALEVAGAACVATSMVATLRPGIVTGAPHALFMSAGVAWFLVQAVLGLAWLGTLAAEGDTLLRSDVNGVLVTVQFYGFLLCVFAGVGLRSFPTFFGMPQPSVRFGLAAFAVLQGGLLLWVATGIAGSGAPRGLAAAGPLLTGCAVLLLVSAFGWWRRETRLAAASQPLAWTLRAVLASLTLTGLLLATTGGLALARGELVPFEQTDATRHVFALGVVTLGIIGMAQLILPEFASERLVRKPGRWHGAAFAAVLLTAVVLRGLLPLFNVEGDARWWLFALAGTVAVGGVIVFGALFTRAQRTHRDYRRRIEARRADALPMAE